MAPASAAEQLETCAKDLTSALHVISASCESPGVDGAGNGHCSPPRPIIPSGAPPQVQQALTCALAAAAKVQTLLGDHSHFLQRLARHNQLLACLQWLCHFQVLACIPMNEAVPLADIASLARVPETELCRVVRMMATAGFLREAQEGYVAHSALSAPLVAHPAVYDAAVFMSETAALAALNMTAVTAQCAGSQPPDAFAYSLACNKLLALGQQPKLLRQWPAYLRHGLGDDDAAVKELFTRLDWGSLGNVKVVDVGAQSTTVAVALATLFPAIRFVVQLREGGPNDGCEATSATNKSFPNGWRVNSPLHGSPLLTLSGHFSGDPVAFGSRLSVEHRTPGTPQHINDASVYILHLPSPSLSTPFQSAAAQVKIELEAHLDVLRTQQGSRIFITARVLPEPGSVDAETEATARMRELSLQQLASGGDPGITDIRNMLLSLRDSFGGLVVTNEFRSPTSSVVAWEVRYQAFRPSLFDSA